MLNKKFVSLFCICMLIMSLCFTVSAFAANEVEIGKCSTDDAVCEALQSEYGTDSTILYSLTQTENCTYSVTITVNGEDTLVWLSAKPNPNVNNNPGSGGIDDTGIVVKPGQTGGINEIELPKTSMDDILNWATTKGNEIIYVLQIFCQPFAIIIFIIAAFMTLIGCIGKSDMVGKGVWGMVLSVVVYAAVLYAPVILQSFVGWVAS